MGQKKWFPTILYDFYRHQAVQKVFIIIEGLVLTLQLTKHVLNKYLS
jgi:hypothetical protein